MSVISAMEQSKYNELKFIYPPGTTPNKAPSDVAEMNEALQESLENDYVLSFTIPKRHEQKKRDEHQSPREQHFHPKSDTTGSECSSGFRRNVILETGFPCVMREPQIQTAKICRTWAWRTWNDKELTRKQQNIMHWKSIEK